jgi:hypothetical protein
VATTVEDDRTTGKRRSPIRLIIVLAAVLVATLLISVVVYIANEDPLTTGSYGVGSNKAADYKDTSDGATFAYHPQAEVYLATIIHNSGPLPVKIEGLAHLPGRNWLGYSPAELRLTNGYDAGPKLGRPFAPFWLGPGRDRGITITYRAVNDCSSLLTDVQQGSSGSFDVQLRFSFLGIQRTQVLPFGNEPPFWIRATSRAECLYEQRQA